MLAPWKGFPDSSVGKESTCNARDPSSIPGLGRSPGQQIGYPLQCSCLENSMGCMGSQRVRHDWATFPLLLGRKAMTNPDSILKSRDITLADKIKAVVFPVVMYGCESWTIKKAEHWRIDAFKLWCWRRLLRVLWTARISNQSIPKEINPEYSLEGLMPKV